MVIIDILSPLTRGDLNIMKFPKATNYALHTMLFLTMDTSNKLVGVQELAEKQKVSPTYLSQDID